MNDNTTKEEMIYCSRCGAEMKKNARYCMKCGNLNYNHPSNENMRPYIADQDGNYVVGSGKMAFKNHGVTSKALASHTGNKTAFFIVNIIMILLIVLVSFLPVIFAGEISMETIFNPATSGLLLIFMIFLIMTIPMEIIYMKANKPWWHAVVPILNLYDFADITMGNGICFLITFIPIVGAIYSLMMLYNLGKKFGKSGWATLFFAPFMLLIIAFGMSCYDGILYIDTNESNSLEKDYNRNKKLLYLLLLIIVYAIFSLYMSFSLTRGLSITSNKSASKTLEDTKLIIETVRVSIEEDKYNCGTKKIDVPGTYYFASDDYYDEYFINFPAKTSGYVKVVYDGEDYVYSVSIVNKKFGIKETKEEDLKKSSIAKTFNLKKPTGGTSCTLTDAGNMSIKASF